MIVSAEVLINSLINGTQKGPSQEFYYLALTKCDYCLNLTN